MTVFISHSENTWMWGLEINAKGFIRPGKATPSVGMTNADNWYSAGEVWFPHGVFDNIIPRPGDGNKCGDNIKFSLSMRMKSLISGRMINYWRRLLA